MKSFQSASLREITTKLFLSDTFDCYRLQEAVFTCAVTYTIDGKINRDFFLNHSAGTVSAAAGGTGEKQAGTAVSSARPSGDAAGVPGNNENTFVSWKDIRPICFSMIRGKRTPLSFRLVLLCPASEAPEYFGELAGAEDSGISSFVLVLQYKDGKITATTAVSYSRFALDRGPERQWDSEAAEWFRREGLPFEAVE
ncbi:MAG: DUF5721 family protein [Lachnospiraceae bacterium]|jgi:hypothetical protein